jgi:hypothetical protein
MPFFGSHDGALRLPAPALARPNSGNYPGAIVGESHRVTAFSANEQLRAEFAFDAVDLV